MPVFVAADVIDWKWRGSQGSSSVPEVMTKLKGIGRSKCSWEKGREGEAMNQLILNEFDAAMDEAEAMTKEACEG